MKLINGLDGFKKKYQNTVLTIGNFDGVHLGHQKIISRVREKAREAGGTAMAITFDPHPMKVLFPERGVRMLTTAEEKVRLLTHYGIDVVWLINFDRDFASIHPEDFIRDILADRIGAREVIVGHGYAFGKGKRGNTELLRRRGGKYGYGLHVVRNMRFLRDAVSSSRIRGLIERGRTAKAARLLGRPYMIHGNVIKGEGRGAKILDTPTANITTPNELVPKQGVYAVKVIVGGREYDGVANIGTNPTFHAGGGRMSYEVHLFGFSGSLIGEEMKVYFIERIRDEQAFPGPEALKSAIEADIEKAREILIRTRGLKLI